MDFAAFTQSHVSTADKLEPMKNLLTNSVYCVLLLIIDWPKLIILNENSDIQHFESIF